MVINYFSIDCNCAVQKIRRPYLLLFISVDLVVLEASRCNIIEALIGFQIIAFDASAMLVCGGSFICIGWCTSSM